MTLTDSRRCTITGVTGAALDAYEQALAAFQRWRTGVEAPLDLALRTAPEFVMAHALSAYRCLTTRDPERVRLAASSYRILRTLRKNRRERLHVAAIGAALADDYEGAKALLGVLLAEHPRDVLALQVVHAFDYGTGDGARMADRVASVLGAWAPGMPGYPAVLAMHAFSMSECGDHAGAERLACKVLEMDPEDGRAHHALAHVHEMTARPEAGISSLRKSVGLWSEGSTVATHCWWHLALFHLARGDHAAALTLYDGSIRAGRSPEVADLIDASALLWRLHLAGADVGERWRELARAWTPHITDRFCSFNDIHAMLAFTGARDRAAAAALERELVACADEPTRHGETTRLVGLPACRGIAAFGLGDHARVIELLGRLPPWVQRIGGSHAQRDVLYLTLMQSIQWLRRPALRVAA